MNERTKIKVKVVYNENGFQPRVYISHLFDHQVDLNVLCLNETKPAVEQTHI